MEALNTQNPPGYVTDYQPKSSADARFVAKLI